VRIARFSAVRPQAIESSYSSLDFCLAKKMAPRMRFLLPQLLELRGEGEKVTVNSSTKA
jgi:hypothetical protein